MNPILYGHGCVLALALSAFALPSPALAEGAAVSSRDQADSKADAALPPQTGMGPRVGPYYLLRFNETLAPSPAAGAPADGFAALKHMPLNEGGDISLSLSGMERVQFNSYSHETLVSQNYSDQLFIGFRHIYGADLHLGSHVRAYGELASGQMGGRDIGPQPPRQRNDLAVQQAFVEVSAPVGDGLLSVRGGRQGVWLGNGLILSTQPFANIPLTFDGVTAQYRAKSARIDVVAVENVANTEDVFGDSSNPGRKIWGVYGSFALPRAAPDVALNVDPFYIGFKSTKLAMAGLVGDDERHGVGARLWGKAGPIQLDTTVVRQGGTFAGQDVEAWAFYSEAGYVMESSPLKPRFGFRFDAVSGGRDGDKIQTFTPLYTGQQYYAASGYLAGSNLVDAGPTLALNLSKSVRLSAYNRWYWKQDRDDAVYGRGFAPLPGTADPSIGYIGMQPDVTVQWTITPHLFLTAEGAYFDVSEGMKRAGGRDVFYSLVDLTFMF
ncbi:alginate export family protein [Brevundimonas guildfordensis]|uniref:Alginate export family protein n=1 Tax=Brevundimonas guildfordensis TaxID=2762241 RepID=A0ABR8QY25_9CAUL|nr:alginate export family protein [Brevundimonas guildfordensis]MBD7940428.1 alginate export family protein [Brevundimonas guildfordensis]